MKKFLTMIGMLICVFGLTACGGEETLTEFEQYKEKTAISKAEDSVLPTLDTMVQNPELAEMSEYTAEEVEYYLASVFGIEVNGNAFRTAVDSFTSAYKEIGGINRIKDATATFDGDQIVVNVELEGIKKDATAEVIFSNDVFLRLQSAALNPVSTMGDSMKKAALNTLLGMGTVFTVLILIALIIACFGVIPKIQASLDAKKTAKEAEKTAGIDNAVAQITGLEESASAEDDLELIAVIAAAIAASEGAASTDGFVVRSIRRRKAY